MSFQYRKHNQHDSNDSFWTSYSDLFLGLSAIFLLLYVVSSLRTGADSIRSQIQTQQLSQQVQDLQNQLQFYEKAKQEYMAENASKTEVDEYQELMDKLTLLQEEAKSENEKLRQAMVENSQKEKALNKYQQMVRNVINASKFEKIKVENRNQVITEKNETIADQTQQISELQQDIQQTQGQLAQNQQEIKKAQKALENRKAQLQKALKDKQLSQAAYQQKLKESQAVNSQRIQALMDQKQQFESELSEAQSAMNALNQQLGQAQRQLASTEGSLAATKGQLSQTMGELEKKQGELAQKQGELQNTRGELAKAQAELSARKNFAKSVQDAFKKKGIKAEVDANSGEVYLDFGDTYFDVDSAKLKAQMKKVIEEAMPVYAKSLLGDPKIAEKVSAVEIIGFASPTYQGRFVDPKSTRREDQEALKYNMDLSYRRARSIFNHVVDRERMTFNHQDELLPLLKVSGRSYLEVAKVNRNVASSEFCKVNDCKKSQRVVIRFSMDKKK